MLGIIGCMETPPEGVHPRCQVLGTKSGHMPLYETNRGVTGAAGNTSRVQPRADCSDTPAGRYVIWYLHLELDRAA